MAAGLASQRLEILSADIHTLDDEYLIAIIFRVVDKDFVGTVPAGRLEEISKAVESCLENELPSIKRRWNPFASEVQAAAKLPPRVQVDNDSSTDATIIEVFAEDSDGLLLALSKTLYEHQFSVRSAKISTYLDQIVDAFHVVDFDGAKVELRPSCNDSDGVERGCRIRCKFGDDVLMGIVTTPHELSTCWYLARLKKMFLCGQRADPAISLFVSYSG